MRWVWIAQLVLGIGALTTTRSAAFDGPPGAELQQAVFGCVRHSLPAVVYLTRQNTPGGCSGTIISSDGLVLTCAHINAKVGDEILVHTADGKRHSGMLLGKSTENGEFGDDLALAQLVDKGPWPFVTFGSSDAITAETALLMFGHPATGLLSVEGETPKCQVRIGYLMRSDHTDKAGLIRTTIRGFGGDSGGPVVDSCGHLIGVATNFENGGIGLTFNTVDLLRKRWAMLGGSRVAPASPEFKCPALPTLDSVFRSTILDIQKLVVEVRSNFRTIASGLIVSRGRVLTKASELGPDLTIAFVDESVASARAIAVDHARDLALLEIGTSDSDDAIPPVPWSKSTASACGELLAVVTPTGFQSPWGVVAVETASVPPMEGSIPVMLEDGPLGVVVVQVVDEVFLPGQKASFPLRVGDTITHVQGSTIQTMSDWQRLYEHWPPSGDRPRIAGEQVTVKYSRGGVAAEASFPLALSHNANHLVRASNLRATGFERVIVAQFHQSRREHCGSPVVNANGQVIGIYIAKSETVEDLVLPLNEVMVALQTLEAASGKK